ncbi:MAG: hypothetical protein PHH26_01910 [Candidatus Thermoplasmatota archaeon]|nr:hypothetical protein [Candidatus Thermoplasmatota archaeon]
MIRVDHEVSLRSTLNPVIDGLRVIFAFFSGQYVVTHPFGGLSYFYCMLSLFFVFVSISFQEKGKMDALSLPAAICVFVNYRRKPVKSKGEKVAV